MKIVRTSEVPDDLNEAADEPVGRAMRVARVLAAKDGDEFAKPGQLVEVRFVKGHSLSLTASRLLALMILTAGGDAWQPVRHKMRKADIRRGHKSNERIGEMLEELHRTLFAEDDRSWRGKKALRRFPLIQSSIEEVEESPDGAESGWIEWEFTDGARKLIQESETYAVLNRQAVLGFRSSYALRLYEMGALRIHRRQPIWKADMTSLRAALGIAPEIYTDFAQLRRKVLEKAKDEIDQLAHFRVEWREIRRGRKVMEVEFKFVAKDAPSQIETVDEIARHAVGRIARREGTVETVSIEKPKRNLKPKVGAKFPTGSLRFGADEANFAKVARAEGGGWDIDLIADAYRQQMAERLDRLNGSALESSWLGFCKAYTLQRGKA